MKKIHLKLKTKIILLSTAFSIVIITLFGIVAYMMLANVLESKIGEDALNVAKTIATMPIIESAFHEEDPSQIIQPIAEAIRKEVGAEFIVIGNKDGIRYSHPYPDRIGKEMVGGDNAPVLEEGKAIISRAKGSLGHSLRGKAPIFDDQQNVIGVVSVGFMMEDIRDWEQIYLFKILFVVILVLFIGIGGSYYLSTNIKKDIFGLEPEEISKLFLEREVILESVKEGIIAVDKNGRITVINSAAKELLKDSSQYNTPESKLIGRHVKGILPNTKIVDVLETGKAHYDRDMLIGGEWVITNRIPLFKNGQVEGVVASFRKKTEIDHLLKELSDHKIYLDTLRAQNHEFTNKLYTISGHLQLKRYDEAIAFITEETVHQDDMIEFLMDHIKEPKLTAFMIGKIIRAQEQKIKFMIDPSSRVELEQNTNIDIDDLITIYGNLIENALDALKDVKTENKRIKVKLTSNQSHLVFVIEDWGKGITEDIIDQIYIDGFTTKGDKNRGLGLALISSLVKKYEGEITYFKPEHRGAGFKVILNK